MVYGVLCGPQVCYSRDLKKEVVFQEVFSSVKDNKADNTNESV